MATENRKFLVRACRFLTTEVGISQFLDCGSGLPTVENTHQVVQRLNPDARVVYVDNDPVVLAYGRALLAENDNTHFASADIFNPREVIDNEVVRELEQLLRGLELVAPGLTLCADWRPEIAQVKPLNQAMYCVAGAVGRKP
jgi:SAM-dependent methyltransferase